MPISGRRSSRSCNALIKKDSIYYNNRHDGAGDLDSKTPPPPPLELRSQRFSDSIFHPLSSPILGYNSFKLQKNRPHHHRSALQRHLSRHLVGDAHGTAPGGVTWSHTCNTCNTCNTRLHLLALFLAEICDPHGRIHREQAAAAVGGRYSPCRRHAGHHCVVPSCILLLSPAATFFCRPKQGRADG